MASVDHTQRQAPRELAKLVALCAASLGFITVVDNLAASALRGVDPSLESLAWIRIPSLLGSLAVCFLLHAQSSLGVQQRGSWSRVAKLCAIWLVPLCVALFGAGIWLPRIRGWIDTTAFMMTGLLAEEFLFRGALFTTAERALSSKIAVIVSALFFALAHLQYHGFAITPEAMTQVAYTLPMGLVFGALRSSTGSVWPVVVLHFANNAIALGSTYL